MIFSGTIRNLYFPSPIKVNKSVRDLVKGELNEFQYNMNKGNINDLTNSLLNVYKAYFDKIDKE